VKSTWSYRIPFALQWVWIVFILVGTFLAPESPWWLVKKQRIDEARKVLLRLTRRDLGFDADSTIAMMEHTNEAEKKMSQGRVNNLSYIECFRGSNRRRTEIACMIFMIQNLSGLPVIAFAAWFYHEIGFDQTKAFNLTLGMHGVALVGAFGAVVWMKHFGRRQLYLAGLGVQFVVLMVAGILSSVKETPSTLWGTASMVIVFIFAFDSLVGPITYSLVAEIPSTRLRVKTVVLARVSYNVCALITNVIQQHMINPLDWDWRGKSCYFWAVSCFLCIVYCYFRLPETKGLTYLELDILFDKGAPARKFKMFQKNLSETGYFSFYQDRPEEPKWREPRSVAG
jgi:MFS transporter, SP family, general alpha glucoside:H+ symporter